MIYEFVEEQYEKAVEDKEKPPNFLWIIDDMGFDRNIKKGQNYSVLAKAFCNGRHINLSTILSSQRISQLLSTCRENATGKILFSVSEKQLELIEADDNYLGDKV